MNEIRCKQCNRLLAKGTALEITIKCPRCGAYNSLRAAPRPSADKQPSSALPSPRPPMGAGRQT
jgi:phage FluMu protein Com